MFLFEKIDQNEHCLCPRKAGGFFYLRTEKVIRLKQCPLYGFRFRKQTG